MNICIEKIFIVVWLGFISCSQHQVPMVLAQNYNFITTDGGVQKLKQSGDTLYEYYCYAEKACTETHYKILDIHKTGDFTILKLKSFDTIPLGEDFCPGKEYSVMSLKNINHRQLGYRPPRGCLTQDQVDTFQINNPLLVNGNFLTFFSDSYLKELSTLKKLSTKDDIEKVIDAIGNNDFNAGKISYSAEELSKACIEKGYNPVGAARVIDSIWKNKIDQQRMKR
jgi:hypothetical protein